MKKHYLSAALVFGAGLLAAAATGLAQNAGGLTVLEFRPRFDDQMTMLVQPRHLKLYYAGKEENWGLAGFEARELSAALRRISESIPEYRGQNLSDTVAAMALPQIDAVNEAIMAEDKDQFMDAYARLTDSCNACHVTLEHAFLVMKVPDEDAPNPFPDQIFTR
jgi:hypothetical protein